MAQRWITPSDYRNDWKGYAERQFLHIALGVVMAFAVNYFWWKTYGEFPFRIHTFLQILFFYAVIIEYWIQLRNQPNDGQCKRVVDSIGDTIFTVLYGSGSVLYASHETDGPAGFYVTAIGDIAPFTFFAGLHLLIGVSIRAYGAKVAKSGIGPN